MSLEKQIAELTEAVVELTEVMKSSAPAGEKRRKSDEMLEAAASKKRLSDDDDETEVETPRKSRKSKEKAEKKTHVLPNGKPAGRITAKKLYDMAHGWFTEVKASFEKNDPDEFELRRDAVIAINKKYGVKKLGDVPAEQLGEAWDDVIAMIDKFKEDSEGGDDGEYDDDLL